MENLQLIDEKFVKNYFKNLGILIYALYEFDDRFLVFIGLEHNPQTNDIISKVEKCGDDLCLTINK